MTTEEQLLREYRWGWRDGANSYPHRPEAVLAQRTAAFQVGFADGYAACKAAHEVSAEVLGV